MSSALREVYELIFIWDELDAVCGSAHLTSGPQYATLWRSSCEAKVRSTTEF